MDSQSVKQLEIARHTIRRAFIWHFGRWFFVPVFVLSVIFGGAAIALKLSVWDEMFLRPLTGYEAAVLGAIAVIAVCVSLALVRLINHATAAVVGALVVTLVVLTGGMWIVSLSRFGDDVIGRLFVMSIAVPFFLSILIHSLRANNTMWLSQLTADDRKIIDDAARRF